MKKNKDITLITIMTIIAVIAIAAVFFGVNHLMDAYVNQQRVTQSGNQAVSGNQAATQSGNQAVGEQQFPDYVQKLIRTTMEDPEESGVCGENLE